MKEFGISTINGTLDNTAVNQLEGFLTKIRESNLVGQFIQKLDYDNGVVRIVLSNTPDGM